MCVKCNMDLKLIYSNGTEIKSLAKDAKYCKQNKLHKYLLPEIMVESKYVEAMKMRERARALWQSLFECDDSDKTRATATQHAFLLCILCIF